MTPPTKHLLTGMNAIKALTQEFDSVDAYLQAVHEILQEGHMPDIKGLDDRVEHLCSTVQTVAPEIQDRCKAKLDALLQKLNHCEEEMAFFQANLPQRAPK